MNKIKVIGFIVTFLLLITATIPSVAQKTSIYIHPDTEFQTGIELFQKEKYGAAQKCFSKTIESHIDRHSLIRIDAEYYKAICSIELFNKDGELFLKQFVKDHPESPKVRTAHFYLGKYNYRKKKYKECLNWFEKVDIYDLTTDELAEFYFKRGNSFFAENKMAEAKKDFYEIKDVDNKYAAPAKYYYAHIAYIEKNYETALKDFLKLKQNETFGTTVPYYIAQLYYLQNKYDSVIAYAPPLLDSASTKRAPEIARIIGEAYYHSARYKEAIPYLKKYEKAVINISREDNYELGYAHYRANEYDDAVNYFIRTTNIDDSLVQNAYYHMGDCYLKTDNKFNARNAFAQASKLNFDKEIQEDALYSYAKLCYDLAFNPYNETIRAFQLYIKNYPDSPRIDEAYAYLANVFITTKSYREALEALENIKTLTPELKQAHQKIAYYRGVDLFNNMQYEEAIQLFEKSMTYPFEKNIRAAAYYWKGEAYYRIKNYPKAIESYLAYTSDPGSIGKMELSDANYNIGYAYQKMADYSNSILWFRKFVTFKPKADEKKINDAYNRIADNYFMNRDFANAVDYYGESFKMKLLNADYALFQKALANGVQKKYSQKTEDLKLFVETFSKSSSTYIQRAKYELAATYLLDNKNDLALNGFQNFIKEYPNSVYENNCLSKIGLIYYTKKDDENAKKYFNTLIARDRKSSDAGEAIEIMKKIYTSKGNVDSLETWLASVGASIPQAALDSIAYNIGKTHYLEQDCKNVIQDFEKYIQKFPEGIFSTQANFYKAECDYNAGNSAAALIGYSYVIGKIKNQFTEHSLSRASDIAYQKQNYILALDYYQQLENQAENPKSNASAKVGLMRCNYQLKKYPEAIDYSNKVLALDKISNELKSEAHFITGQTLLATEKYDEAFAEFKAVSTIAKNELGAESSYNVAYIQYLKNEYKQSQKSIFDFINDDGDHPYWVTKALILLADSYIALKDNFQAKATLKGIISESDIPELIKLSQTRLEKIIADEDAAKLVTPKVEPLKIEFEGNTIEQNKLFTEPELLPTEGEEKHE